ncbi:MAG: formate dehydrogenase accessory sulfurtransferase FdhD [Candidatus Jordarchaeales archaeon]
MPLRLVFPVSLMLQPSVKVKVKKVDLFRGKIDTVDDWVSVETAVVLYINGERATTFLSLPSQLKELCVGWLLTQSIVDSVDDIESVQVENGKVRVRCSKNIKARLKALGPPVVTDSACGSENTSYFYLIDRITKPFVDSKYRVKAEDLSSFMKVLNEKAQLFKLTGGTHSAALFSNGELVAFAEDVGRHNTVDKVVGSAALNKADFSSSVLVSTGRQPASMVMKAARVGIPIIASISAPLYSGIIAAEQAGVTLVCFVRGKRMNIYTHHERITGVF